MTQQQLNLIGCEIIKNNIYFSLATASNNYPWIAPLYYAVDEKFNFYFISQLESLHTKQMLKNPTVAFAIFDSHQKEGTGNGVQGTGEVKMVEDNELDEAFKWYRSEFIPTLSIRNKKTNYRIFKMIPKKLYVLDPEAKVDKRVEIFII